MSWIKFGRRGKKLTREEEEENNKKGFDESEDENSVDGDQSTNERYDASVLLTEDSEDSEILDQYFSLVAASGVVGGEAINDVPYTDSMDIDALKVRALLLAEKGHKEEALVVMRRIRCLQDEAKASEGISCKPYGSASDAKGMAVQLHKAGYKNHAIRWLRYAKRVEAGSPIAQRSVSPVFSPAATAEEEAAAAQLARRLEYCGSAGSKQWLHARLMLVGEGRAGKTAVANSILGKGYQNTHSTIGTTVQ